VVKENNSDKSLLTIGWIILFTWCALAFGDDNEINISNISGDNIDINIT